MAVYRITAPVRGVNATVAGVRLVEGVGQVDGDKLPSALAYFRRHGYQVEQEAPAPAPVVDEQPPPAPVAPNRGSSKAEWVTYVTSPHAPEDKRLTEAEAADRTRDQLAEHVLGPKED
ncbi:hypothetical protein EDC02_5935 [Micromonospora sp. Llam0]|uniref:hypothetical protein n=1 Tax=Micromonospora sp. Llam0 TaxID=2485143 RepID=UPI000F497FE9|nr:hypothetical protein [Micromonospora sp. Llam0]ROO51071.1 hypothetical protein EDC02_5935 [Micromonospora sp. Llam0]